MVSDRALLIDHAGEMTQRAYSAEEERDDANRALEMERAAHRVTVARLAEAKRLLSIAWSGAKDPRLTRQELTAAGVAVVDRRQR